MERLEKAKALELKEALDKLRSDLAEKRNQALRDYAKGQTQATETAEELVRIQIQISVIDETKKIKEISTYTLDHIK